MGREKEIEFVYPHKTTVVSVTGNECSLSCAHCNGHYLNAMVSPAKAREMTATGKSTSCLISGGCTPLGKVPLLNHQDFLVEMAARVPLNLHVGLVDQGEAKILGKLGRVVSFDMVGDKETIKEVYGLGYTPEDYLQSYRYLRREVHRVVPHICIGLRGGVISGERKALALLKKEGVDALCFLVFRPTPGTAFAHCAPPSLMTTVKLIKEARLLFPHVPLYLGCMRPGGAYRQSLDPLAVKASLNKIVSPAPSALATAKSLGLTIKTSEECCAL